MTNSISHNSICDIKGNQDQVQSSIANLRTEEAAKILGVSKFTLERWRVVGGGPRFYRIGARAVRYRLSDLLAFTEAGARNNTSESAR